jgi:transposase InsO family protein
MDTTQLPTLNEMADFVSGSQTLSWHCQNKQEVYVYVNRVLAHINYCRLCKADKGITKCYLAQVTGYSRSQITRLVREHVLTGRVQTKERTQPTFSNIYTKEDIAELARIDELHDNLNGAAMVKILQREYVLFGNQACERLQHLSVSHLYNLRKTNGYQRIHIHYTKTKAVTVPIGQRVKPKPNGSPGFIRVDSVHQGDKDGEKGVYHINLVDEVLQWEIVVCVEGISERFMLPALIAAMSLFPFNLVNFHADNGSEYINRQVAKLLERLLVKLTKSRPRHSGDNGLVETKNGAIIRKALGYLHIPRTPDNVEQINKWCRNWFVPYLNFHRPCAYRTTSIDPKSGKQTHRYPKDGYMTPYEKFKSLPNAGQYLKPNLSFELLDLQAYAMSDTQWADAMQIEKAAMWASIKF